MLGDESIGSCYDRLYYLRGLNARETETKRVTISGSLDSSSTFRLTLAEADKRFNDARFARNLFCSLAA